MEPEDQIQEEIDEEGENLTQRRMEPSDEPVDASWEEKSWGETAPAEGAEEQERDAWNNL